MDKKFLLDKKTKDVLDVSYYAFLEAPFKDYFSGKKDRNKMPKDLFYPAIDLWLCADHYGLKGHPELLEIVKAALRAEQKSRLYAKLKKKEAHKAKGKKSPHDAELIVRTVDKHFKRKYMDYLIGNKESTKPTLSQSYKYAKNKLEDERDGYEIEEENVRKIYSRNRIYPKRWLIIDAYNSLKKIHY